MGSFSFPSKGHTSFNLFKAHLYQVVDGLQLAIEDSLVQCIAIGALQLAVHVEAVGDEEGDDLVMAGLCRQQESRVRHVRALQVRLGVLARLEQDGHHLQEAGARQRRENRRGEKG